MRMQRSSTPSLMGVSQCNQASNSVAKAVKNNLNISQIQLGIRYILNI